MTSSWVRVSMDATSGIDYKHKSWEQQGTSRTAPPEDVAASDGVPQIPVHVPLWLESFVTRKALQTTEANRRGQDGSGAGFRISAPSHCKIASLAA
jgi:hypothetical protein